MKVEISTPDLIVPIKITLPTALIRSRLLWKTLEKHADTEQVATIMKYQPLVTLCADELEDYVRMNGHFNLVEVDEAGGARVVITI